MKGMTAMKPYYEQDGITHSPAVRGRLRAWRNQDQSRATNKLQNILPSVFGGGRNTTHGKGIR